MLKSSNVQLKRGIKTVDSFSLEDLMVFVKEKDSEDAKSVEKRERRKCSATSSSSSDQVNCHVSKIFFKIYSQLLCLKR